MDQCETHARLTAKAMQDLVQRYVARPPACASMTKLAAEGTKSISIPVSSDERVEVSIRPLTFDSPVTFNVISKSATADSEKDRADEEIEDEDDDEPDDEPGQGDEPGEDQR
jgi:hypothetical protein